MEVNVQRRMLLAATGGLAAGLFGGNAATAAENELSVGLPADVRRTPSWLILRFADQGGSHAGMLAPVPPNGKATIDFVLRYGIFFTGYRELYSQISRFQSPAVSLLKARGAAASVEQTDILFEDFDFRDPIPEIEARASAEAEALRRDYREDGKMPEDRIQCITAWYLSPPPAIGAGYNAVKIRGQIHGTAGLAFYGASSTLDESIKHALFFRSLDEIRLWRFWGIGVYLSSFADLRYAQGFSNRDLADMPREPWPRKASEK